MTTQNNVMNFVRYQASIDLYAGLRVKRSFTPIIEPIDQLEALILANPEGTLRVGLARVPASMIERGSNSFATPPLDHGQDRMWVVAQCGERRYLALGQFVPRIISTPGYFPRPNPETDLDAR